jgi:adenylosuccinate synthase
MRGGYGWTARYQGGSNAGHTVYDGSVKVVLHTIPTGILFDGMNAVIGNGVVIELDDLQKEIAALEAAGRMKGKLYISDRAHIIHPYLRELEVASGDAEARGTTKHGIGPAYMMKAARKGLRVCDLRSSAHVAEKMREAIFYTRGMFPQSKREEFCAPPYARQTADEIMKLFEHITRRAVVCDTSHLINMWLAAGENGLAEGAQGTGLSIDHGTYPYVTSSNTESGGVCIGLGIGPTKVEKTIGVAKAYVTRVGAGPFPTLMKPPEKEEEIRQRGNEFGATTGRPRRCGWYDAVLAKKAVEIGDVSELAITKSDVLSGQKTIYVSTKYLSSDGRTVTEFPADIGLADTSDSNSSNYAGILDTLFAGWDKIECDNISWEFRGFLNFVETSTGAPITLLSTGPKLDDMTVLKTV